MALFQPQSYPEDEDNGQSVYFPYELMYDIDDFDIGPRVTKGNDYYHSVTYRKERIRLQTPPMVAMFGLKKYFIPGDNNPKYSLNLSLKETSQEITEFGEFVRKLDKFVQKLKGTKGTYCSSITDDDAKLKDPSSTHSPLLRVKIHVCRKDRLLVDVISPNGDVIALPDEETFRKLVPARCNVKCIIEVNPVWFAGNKFGISFRVLKLQVVPDTIKPVRELKFR